MELHYGKPEEAGMLPEAVRHLEDTVQSWVDNGDIQNFVYLVARKGIIVSHKAVGYVRPEPGSPPVSVDTLYPLASLSKPITTAAAMVLVDKGLLSLSFPVQYYIPEFQGENKEKVLVRHLPIHASGLRSQEIYEHMKKKEENLELPPCPENQHPEIHKRLNLMYDAPLWKKPGQEMSYCGDNIALLGEIIRRISGMSLDSFTRKYLFDPMGMDSTRFIVPEEWFSRVVHRPEDIVGGKWFDTPFSMQLPSAPGGCYSIVKDIAIFAQMFLNRGKYGNARILSPASANQMLINQAPGISSEYGDEFFKEAFYSYGWSIVDDKKEGSDLLSKRAINCGGAGGTELSFDPESEMVMVMFSIADTPNDGKSVWYPKRYLFTNMAIAAIDD